MQYKLSLRGKVLVLLKTIHLEVVNLNIHKNDVFTTGRIINAWVNLRENQDRVCNIFLYL